MHPRIFFDNKFETLHANCRPILSEEDFHELADDTLHRLQDKLDAYVEDKLDEGDVSFEVREPLCTVTLLYNFKPWCA